MVIAVTATVAGSGQSTATHGDVGFSWVGSYKTGVSADGAPYVVAPNGIKLNSPTPAVDADGNGKLLNGAAVNQAFISTPVGNFWPYDGRRVADALPPQPDFAAVQPVGSAVLKGVSENPLPVGWEPRWGMLTAYGGLHVVASAPPAGAFAAPFVWPSADIANRPWRVADVDGLLSALPSYATTAMASKMTWAALKPRFEDFDLGRAMTYIDATTGYEAMTVSGAEPGSNYGRYLTSNSDRLSVGLMSDYWSESDKTDAVIHMLRLGGQVLETIVKRGTPLVGAGGHDYGVLGAATAWIKATGREAQVNTLLTALGTAPVNQYIEITEGLFEPHDSDSLPNFARRREVLSITNGGLTVVVKHYHASDVQRYAKMQGLDLVRESSGNKARITDDDNTSVSGQTTLTLSSAISGLAVDDIVYGQDVLGLTAGTKDWQITGDTNRANPSPLASYRSLNFPGTAHLFVHALGLSGSALAKPVAYLARTMEPGSPLPSQVDSGWQTDFFNAHAEAILALPQTAE